MSDYRERATGRVALVTGASSGIGEAVARRLGREPLDRLVLVARREQRLQALGAELSVPVSWVAVDLTDEDAPRRVREHLAAEAGGRLHLLVNNAGGSRRATFAEGGYENVRQTMALNFDAQLRLTEELLPLLRNSAPSAIVNVASVAGRASRPRTGAYSASKAALCAWSDALYGEEAPNGVHVGLVMPGFIATEGFPAQELTGRAATRWLVSRPEVAAEAILTAGFGRRPEVFVPRPWKAIGTLRTLLPGVAFRILRGGQAERLTTQTGADSSANGSSPRA